MADDLTGADRILCSPKQATACWAGEGCNDRALIEGNVPHFIEIDLKAKTLSTTEASGANRSTKILHMTRDGDLIILHGYELRRAFTMVISVGTGIVTLAVAGDDEGVVGFSVCTPLK